MLWEHDQAFQQNIAAKALHTQDEHNHGLINEALLTLCVCVCARAHTRAPGAGHRKILLGFLVSVSGLLGPVGAGPGNKRLFS